MGVDMSSTGFGRSVCAESTHTGAAAHLWDAAVAVRLRHLLLQGCRASSIRGTWAAAADQRAAGCVPGTQVLRDHMASGVRLHRARHGAESMPRVAAVNGSVHAAAPAFLG